MVKFGVCSSDFDQIQIAIDAGVEYVEMGVSNTLTPLESDETFEPVRKRIEALSCKSEAFNLFFPGSVRITGPNVDWDLVRRYAAKAVERAASVGGKAMVIGSGGARNVPEGYSWDEAWKQLVKAFTITGEEAAKWDVTIVIEPLRKQESNIVNFVSEGVQLAKEIGHPNVKVLADFYHIDEGDEPMTHILDAGPMLAHVHVADTGRFRPGSGAYDYDTFFKYLKQINYAGLISMEGTWNAGQFGDEVTAGLAFLREKWAAA